MSKIKFKQINNNEVSVTLDSNIPLDMVEQLTKSLEAKGMIEDKASSSVTCRYFYKPQSANNVADELIKSLQSLTKGIDPSDLSNPYSKASQAANREKNRINDRRAQTGSPPLNESQIAAAKVPKAPAAPAAPTTPSTPASENSGPRVLTGGPNKLVNTYSSQSMSYKKSEDGDDCECSQEDCEKCIAKSNYGPKGSGQYSATDNARRKANNTGDQTGFGQNVNTKQYTSAKFGNSTPQTDPKLKRPQPVKSLKDGTLNPSVAEAIKAKANLKKGWGQHLPFPSAEEEIMKLAKRAPQSGEDASANQLAALMAGKNLLGNNVHPAVKAMMAPPPPQPTDEQMFGHLVVSEEMAKAKENEWSSQLNNFFAEASKPISQRFSSEEEELAYWASIKVEDRDDGKSGY